MKTNRPLSGILIIGIVMAILLSSCSGDAATVSAELARKASHVQSPKGLTAVSDHIERAISLTWDAVDGAEFYVVERMGGAEFIREGYAFGSSGCASAVANSPSYLFDASSSSGDDRRWVFRVRAGVRGRNGDAVLSSPSEMAEAMVLDRVSSFECISDEDTKAGDGFRVTFNYMIPSTDSLLSPGESLVESYEREIYEKDENNLWTAIDEENASVLPLETKSFKLSLMVDGEETASMEAEATGGVDKYPAPIEKVTATASDSSHISVAFDSEGINDSILQSISEGGDGSAFTNEDVQLRFLIERKETNGDDDASASYSPLSSLADFTDEDGFTKKAIGTNGEVTDSSLSSTLMILEASNGIAKKDDESGLYSVTFTDTTVDKGKSYQYRVTPYYIGGDIRHECRDGNGYTESDIVSVPSENQ